MDIVHYLRHQFDGDPIYNVYNREIVNMSVGAPGPDILKYCTEMLQRSTQHRLVKLKYFNIVFVFVFIRQ